MSSAMAPAALLAFVLAGLSISQSAQASASQDAQATPESTRGTEWVAERAGQVLELRDIDAHIAHLPRELRAGFIDSPTRIQKLIQDLMLNRQFAQEARSRGLDKHPLFPQMLKLLEEQLLGGLLTAQLRDDISPEDVALAARERFALAPVERYGKPGAYHVRQILVEARQQGETRAKESAQRAHARLLAGEDFETVALAHSVDIGRTDHEGLPRPIGMIAIEQGSQVSELVKEAVFGLTEPGDISEIVESQFGLHIFVLSRIESAQPARYEEVEAQVLKETEEWLRQRRVESMISLLRNQPLEANEATISTLRSRYPNGDIPGVP